MKTRLDCGGHVPWAWLDVVFEPERLGVGAGLITVVTSSEKTTGQTPVTATI